MKKLIYVFCCILLISGMQVSVKAGKDSLQEGYTAEGVYYQVFDWENGSKMPTGGDVITVNKCFMYMAIVKPERTIDYSQDGYAGVLTLCRVVYSEGKTYAYYAGTLTLQE